MPVIQVASDGITVFDNVAGANNIILVTPPTGQRVHIERFLCSVAVASGVEFHFGNETGGSYRTTLFMGAGIPFGDAVDWTGDTDAVFKLSIRITAAQFADGYVKYRFRSGDS